MKTNKTLGKSFCNLTMFVCPSHCVLILRVECSICTNGRKRGTSLAWNSMNKKRMNFIMKCFIISTCRVSSTSILLSVSHPYTGHPTHVHIRGIWARIWCYTSSFSTTTADTTSAQRAYLLRVMNLKPNRSASVNHSSNHNNEPRFGTKMYIPWQSIYGLNIGVPTRMPWSMIISYSPILDYHCLWKEYTG